MTIGSKARPRRRAKHARTPYDVRSEIHRVTAALDELSERLGAAAAGFHRVHDTHATDAQVGALGHALHREATAATVVLLEASHLAGQLVALARAGEVHQ